MRNTIWKKGMAMGLFLSLFVGNVAAASTPTVENSTKEGNTSTSTVVSGSSVTVTGGAVGTKPLIESLDTPTVSVRGGSKRIRITWNSIANAEGYYVYLKSPDSTEFKKVKDITSGSTVTYTKKLLTQNATYSVKVSAYAKNGETVVESGLSKAVKGTTTAVAATSKVAFKYKGKSKFQKSPAYKTFTKMKNGMNYSKSFAIPGLKNTNVAGFACTTMEPQAICHAGSYLLISAYDKKGVDKSVIYVVSKSSKSYITTIVLPSKAKVQGMAYDGKNVWISKGASVAHFPYKVVTDAVNSGSAYVSLASYSGVQKMNGTASFMGYYNGILWVGTFSATKSTTMYGYAIANKETFPSLTQTYTMSVPSRTQGITFKADGALILSQSYRAKSSQSGYVSRLRTYYPSYNSPSSKGGIKKNAVVKKTKMPPKMEGVAVYGSYTYTLFASTRYSGCKYPVDRVIAMKTNKLITG